MKTLSVPFFMISLCVFATDARTVHTDCRTVMNKTPSLFAGELKSGFITQSKPYAVLRDANTIGVDYSYVIDAQHGGGTRTTTFTYHSAGAFCAVSVSHRLIGSRQSQNADDIRASKMIETNYLLDLIKLVH